VIKHTKTIQLTQQNPNTYHTQPIFNHVNESKLQQVAHQQNKPYYLSTAQYNSRVELGLPENVSEYGSQTRTQKKNGTANMNAAK
jgi:hypothetical protein